MYLESCEKKKKMLGLRTRCELNMVQDVIYYLAGGTKDQIATLGL